MEEVGLSGTGKWSRYLFPFVVEVPSLPDADSAAPPRPPMREPSGSAAGARISMLGGERELSLCSVRGRGHHLELIVTTSYCVVGPTAKEGLGKSDFTIETLEVGRAKISFL